MLDAIKGSFYGALIGDALGVPYEFHYFDIPARVHIEMEPRGEFNRSHKGTPVGTWSDDGALLLALTSSLASNPSLDLNDFAKRMLQWYRKGEYAVDRRVFDIGITTQMGLLEFEAGTPPSLSGSSDERDNGNGALMRVLPVSYLVCDDKETVRVAMEQGFPTHRHIRSQLACALYALIVKKVIMGISLQDARDAANQIVCDLFYDAHEDDLVLFLDDDRKVGTGTGYVVDTYWSAIDAVEQTDSFEECIRYAVALGHDTDTTACVAGGIAGAMYGYSELTPRWLEALRWKGFAGDVFDAFMAKVRTC